MLNIVIPMAGSGSRFVEAAYREPKPLIPVCGIPMIEVVINNLRPSRDHRFIFICQEQHQRDYKIATYLRKLDPACDVILLQGLTQGAACTVLTAKSLINDQSPLMIANCDQWIDLCIDAYLDSFDACHCDGFIMTMFASEPKWSFVQRNGAGRVTAVVEKQVISDEATVGIYNFASGRDFVDAAEGMIQENVRVNNEFYVAPVYTRLATAGKEIQTFNIGTDQAGMYGLGTPADLQHFLKCEFSARLQSERREIQRAA